MKNLTTLLTATLFASAAITAQAGNPISNLTYEDSSNIFAEVSTQSSTPEVIFSYGDDANKNSVWSTEFEQYVNPADFQQGIASVEAANRLMGDSPTASGTSRETFIYNELAGEYHLQ